VVGLFAEMDCLFHTNEHLLDIKNQHQVPDMVHRIPSVCCFFKQMVPDYFLHPLKDSMSLDKMVLFSRFLPHQGVTWIGNSIFHISYQWYKRKVACIFYVHSIVLELCDFRDCIDLLLSKISTLHNIISPA